MVCKQDFFRQVHIERGVENCPVRLGVGCASGGNPSGPFHIDIHSVAPVAGKGAAYSGPGFHIRSLVGEDFHSDFIHRTRTHADPNIPD